MSWLWDRIKEFLEHQWQIVSQFLKDILHWAFDLVKTVLAWALDKILDICLPDGTLDTSTLQDYYAYINYLFPLEEFFALFGCYLTFLLTFITVKLIVKFIPTVG